MAKCEKCGVELQKEDTYEVSGKTLCEDCAVKLQVNPAHKCGE